MSSIRPHLTERIASATAVSRREIRRGEVLVAAARAIKDPDTVTTHCAWCDRHALGGHWLEPDELPLLVRSTPHNTSHGICPRCFQSLRDRGLSH